MGKGVRVSGIGGRLPPLPTLLRGGTGGYVIKTYIDRLHKSKKRAGEHSERRPKEGFHPIHMEKAGPWSVGHSVAVIRCSNKKGTHLALLLRKRVV